jgi:hypothetical protein
MARQAAVYGEWSVIGDQQVDWDETGGMVGVKSVGKILVKDPLSG